MSRVTVPFGDNASDTATLLLAAAEELGLDPSVVQTNGRRSFTVPEEVNAQAFGKSEPKRTTKKTAAKKSTASKESKS